MTQYLLGQMEQLQKIENEHQNQRIPIDDQTDMKAHEDDNSNHPLYNFVDENTGTHDDDEF